MKKTKLQIWISMFSFFENRKTTYFDVFSLNFSLETKTKTLFLISYFNLSKKKNETNIFSNSTRNATRSNNRNDLLHLTSIYKEDLYITKSNILWWSFIAKIVSR